MNPILQCASTQIDEEIGFRYRTVYVDTENSKLHYHDYYEIFLTLSDNLYHYINGVEQTLHRGTLVFIRKEDVHYYSSMPTKGISFINLAFTEEIMNGLFSFLSDGFCSAKLLSAKNPPSISLPEHDVEWLMRQTELLNSTMIDDTDMLKYRARVLLFKIFTKFFSGFSEYDPSENNVIIPAWLKKLDAEMHKPENFSLGAEHMVEMSGKCRAYLGRMMKQYYKTTIPDYINDLRLNFWANSLINSDAPILDICFECGFENVSWAYSLFKNKYGTTPLKFRKNNF